MRTMIITRTAFVFYFLSAILSSYGQAVYHVSSSGNDGNNGLSPATAFKSIDKVNSLKLNPGDEVLFNSGDTFRGQLSIRQAGTEGKPIIIGSYGSGAKPFLNGSVEVVKWTRRNGNIWEADCPQCKDSVTGIYRDRYSLPLGRYPNASEEGKGYLKILSHNGSAQFTGQQPAARNWAGGEAVVRTNDWIIDKSRISAQEGNKYTLASNTSYEIRDNWGYFIQDHPGTLDQNGEWYYDRANKKLLLYSSSADPNKHLIEATAFSRCINVYASFVTVQDLHIGQSLNIGVYGRNSSNLTIIHCDISNMGEDAVVINGSGANITLKGNNIDHVNNDGIYITGYSNFICQGNKLKNVGTEEGRGKSNNGQYMGLEYVYIGTDGASVIKNNELDSIGYIGIDFNSSNISVEENVISNFDLVKNDGGAIDTYNGKNHTDRKNQKISSNIIFNALGANSGTTDSFTGATGIYLDIGSENINITGNTVFNCTGNGIFLSGSKNIVVNGNVSYGNNVQFLMADAEKDGFYNQSNVISDNEFLNSNDHQVVERLLQHQSKAVAEQSFPNTLFKTNLRSENLMSLHLDKESVLFEVNKTGTNRVIKLNGLYKDAGGKVYQDDLILQPYSSIVLFKSVR